MIFAPMVEPNTEADAKTLAKPGWMSCHFYDLDSLRVFQMENFPAIMELGQWAKYPLPKIVMSQNKNLLESLIENLWLDGHK